MRRALAMILLLMVAYPLPSLGKDPPDWILKWGSQGSGAGQLSYPSGTAVDTHGLVYVADGGNSRIQVFDPLGNFVRAWGTQGSGPGQFQELTSICTDSAGNVYTVERGGNPRIQKFDSSGTYLGSWGGAGSDDGQFQNPWDVEVDPGGMSM